MFLDVPLKTAKDGTVIVNHCYTKRGIDVTRPQIVSWGEESPVCKGSGRALPLQEPSRRVRDSVGTIEPLNEKRPV
jgi:hypothetical protein